MFHSIQYKNGCLAVSDYFIMFTQSVKFYTFLCQLSKSNRCLKKVILQNVFRKNEWLLLPAGFTAKFG